jgi:hypothetical protein
MLKRPATRIELKPDDIEEYEQVMAMKEREKKSQQASTPLGEKKSTASRIGLKK